MLLVFRRHFQYSCSKSSLFSLKQRNLSEIACSNTFSCHSYVATQFCSTIPSLSRLDDASNSRHVLAKTQITIASRHVLAKAQIGIASRHVLAKAQIGIASRHVLAKPQISIASKRPIHVRLHRLMLVSFYSSSAPLRLRGPPSRSLRRRISRRAKAAAKPILDEAQFQRAVSQLLPRFTPEELCNVMTSQEDPLVCLELFNWASKQHRFRHNVSTYHVAIQKLGEAKMYEEMDAIVDQVLAIPSLGSESLFNSMIHYFTENRKLTKAVNVYKHMQNSRKLDCRPSIKTYNILFAALLSRRTNPYINHMYMDTIRSLFKQMVDNGIEPDIFSLNTMIKGYVLSLHVNDALRIYHQMGVVYQCQPNSFSYDYLIHGLCSQGRTKNAKEIYNEMKCKGLIPSCKSYNSLVNSLALVGEVDEAVKFLWEMNESRRSIDFITFRTVIDEICRQRTVQDAMCLLKELQDKDLIDGLTYRKLLYDLEDDVGNINVRNG